MYSCKDRSIRNMQKKARLLYIFIIMPLKLILLSETNCTNRNKEINPEMYGKMQRWSFDSTPFLFRYMHNTSVCTLTTLI